MGRELKRVALDFDFPVNETWDGYVNPYYVATECAECNGTGNSPSAAYLYDQWYGKVAFKPEDRGSKPFAADHPIILRRAIHSVGRSPEFYGIGNPAVNREAIRLSILFNSCWSHHLNDQDVAALLKAGRLMDLTHTIEPGKGWVPKDPPYVPTAAEVNEWSIDYGIGHDAINCWTVIGAECARLEIVSQCAHCDGEGAIWPDEASRERYDNWKSTEPPAGEGYQIWQTVSEGGPVSPVFATPEELALYMSKHPWGADKGTSYDTWMKFILGPGWAPSMINNKFGVESVTENE